MELVLDDLAARPPTDLRILPVIHALIDGVRRVVNTPALLFGIYLVTVVSAAPLAFVVRDAIEQHLGTSAVAESVEVGVNWAWWEEFQSQATGVNRTFNPQILGFAASLTNLSDLMDGTAPSGSILLALLAYLLIWTFLAGGVIDRLSRQRRVGGMGFFGACGTHFFRLGRLALLSGTVYGLLFGFAHEWIFTDLYEMLTRNLSVERTTFAVYVSLYCLFGLLVLPVNLVLDYSRIRVVVEDRRSVLGSTLASLRFVWRHPSNTFGLYGLNALIFLGILGVYAAVAPLASFSLWAVFIVGQGYILARGLAKLIFYSSQISFFQSRLAHAKYVGSPPYIWPDSPTAEIITGSSVK